MSSFFFNDTATTEIYTLSLHDALPIFHANGPVAVGRETALEEAGDTGVVFDDEDVHGTPKYNRSEEHTSELQSRQYLVCRLLLEKKKHIPITNRSHTCPLAAQNRHCRE